MKLYSKDSNPIAKATIALIHDTRNASDNQLFRAVQELKRGRDAANLSYAIRQIEEASKKIRDVVDMLYSTVRDAPEPTVHPAESDGAPG